MSTMLPFWFWQPWAFNVKQWSKLNSRFLIRFLCFLNQSLLSMKISMMFELVASFTFRAALILNRLDPTRCLNYSSGILVHTDMITSHSCCIIVGCQSRCKSPVPLHPKGALLYCDLVAVEAMWLQWTRCHVQETILRSSEFCDMVH